MNSNLIEETKSFNLHWWLQYRTTSATQKLLLALKNSTHYLTKVACDFVDKNNEYFLGLTEASVEEVHTWFQLTQLFHNLTRDKLFAPSSWPKIWFDSSNHVLIDGQRFVDVLGIDSSLLGFHHDETEWNFFYDNKIVEEKTLDVLTSLPNGISVRKAEPLNPEWKPCTIIYNKKVAHSQSFLPRIVHELWHHQLPRDLEQSMDEKWAWEIGMMYRETLGIKQDVTIEHLRKSALLSYHLYKDNLELKDWKYFFKENFLY